MRVAILVLAAAVAACGGTPDAEVETGTTTQASTGSIVVNGSFETGDYTGWTLFEGQQNGQPDGSPQSGTWGIATNGQTINPGDAPFDFFDHINVNEGSPGLPITYEATDGNFVAFQLQNGGESHRMFQTVALPACQPLLLWDMAYNNHQNNFDANQQIAVNIRDPNTDQILATPFVTPAGSPPIVSPMAPFQVDLTAFSAQTVRIDYDQEVFEFFFDAEYDNIRIICKGLSASPGVLDFGDNPIGTTTKALSTNVTNFAATPLTISAANVANPEFKLVAGPALPITLSPGASTSFAVTFRASSAGAQSGTLTLVSNDPNGNTVVALKGNGVGSPVLSTSVPELDFGGEQVGQTTASQEVDLQNTGVAPLTISQIATSPGFEVTSAPGVPITLPPGAAVPVFVAFAPAIAGPQGGSLHVVSNDPKSPLDLPLTGIGESPVIQLSTTALHFGDIPVNTTSGTQTVTATNAGSGPLTISNVQVPPPFNLVSGTVPVVLAPGDSVDYVVTFSPQSEGLVSTSMTFTSDAGTSPDSIVLDGNGIAPHISINPLSVNFGNQHLGTTGSQSIVVTNTGTDTLRITSLDASAQFGDADALPIDIAPNGTATLTVTFTPQVTGDVSGTLTIGSNAGAPLSVPLDGTGILGALSIAPGAVNFGNQRVGTTSGAQIVTITNVGTDVVHIASTSLSGGPFSLVPPVTNVLAPGGSTQLSITFSPVVAGPASTTLTILSDSPTSPDHVGVIGTGVEPLVSVNPASLAFGTQRAGTTSKAKSFVIKNIGTSALVVTSVNASGVFAASFTGPVTLDPTESTSVNVTFSPAVAGATTGTVTITSNATTSPTVALTGTGIAPIVSPSTAALAFGTQRLTTSSPSQAVTLSNTGTAPLLISSATLPAGFVLTPPSAFPISVLPSGHATFGVVFAPTSLGPVAGSLSFTTDAAGSPTLVGLTGTGVQATVALDPTSKDFGDVRVGTTSAPATVTISNPGSDPYVVSAVALAAPFAIVTPPSLPATIAPGGSIAFDIVFSPTAHKSVEAAISITTDAGFASVGVSGRGVAPLISASSTTLGFGTVPILTTAPLPLTLSNPGDAALTISSLAFSGTNAGDFAFVTPPTLPATVPAGGALALQVTFTPHDHGARTAQLVAGSDALGTSALPIALTGAGSGSRIVVNVATLDLGSTNVGVTSATRSVTVDNTGETGLVVSSIVIGGANVADFATTVVPPVTVAPGKSAQLSFTFTPTATGARSASATIVSNDALAPTKVVALTGTGLSPSVAVSSSTLAFGDVRVGTNSVLALTISNTGTGPLAISGLDLSGADAADLAVEATTLPFTLAATAQRTIHVTFTPSTLGAESATLSVLSDDPISGTLAVPITGNGVSPTVSISPPSVDFGGQLVGRTSDSRQITISNPGTGALAVTALAFGGAQGSAFVLVSPPALPATIAPSSQLVLNVTFAPTAIAAHAGELDITTDSPDAPNASVDLTGLGISTAMTVTPSNIDFGTAHVGATTQAVAVTLMNLSNDPIVLDDGVLGGAMPGDFTVTSIASTLAPGASVSAMVAYAPASARTSGATLTLSSNDPAIPDAVVALAGKSVSAFVTVDHGTLDFGQIEVGDHSGGKPVAITNTTTSPITIASITSTDGQFIVDSSAATAGPIPPGGSVTFTIAFGPTSVGTSMTGVAITLAMSSTPEVTVMVTGEGTAKPAGGCDVGQGGSGAGWLGLGLAVALVAGRRKRR